MKIGIFTLPFNTNYGGILQAYALQTVLERLGHDVVVLKHQDSTPKRLNIKVRYLIYIKRFTLKYIFGKDIVVREDKANRDKYLNKISEINNFIYSHIKSVEFNINKFDTYSLEAIIVGSDQVWRPFYANPIKKYFLDFLYDNHSILKIAYAASFGTENWEYSDKDTEICSKLIKDFDAVTVREDSAVRLCNKYFGIKAIQVLDPTMLLDKEDYIKLVLDANIPKFNGNLFAYILDETKEKTDYISLICKKTGLIKYEISSIDNYKDTNQSLPAVQVWLRAFWDADFIVTDSFHGCVFSIIFNKPFIVIGNDMRGMARFSSILRLFHLENRLVKSSNLSTEPLLNNLNWEQVNTIKDNMKTLSMSIITTSLHHK